MNAANLERYTRTLRQLKLAGAEIEAARWALEAMAKLPSDVVLPDGQERIVRHCAANAILYLQEVSK